MKETDVNVIVWQYEQYTAAPTKAQPPSYIELVSVKVPGIPLTSIIPTNPPKGPLNTPELY